MLRTFVAELTVVGLLAVGGCGGGAAAPSDGAAAPMCTSTSDGAPAMSPATFCAIFLPGCGTGLAGYGSMSECVASYSALTTTKPVRQACQSYHLCQAIAFEPGSNRDNHCGHASGFAGNQACEQVE